MSILFYLIGITIIGAAILIGFEVAHDEERFMTIGIAGCFFLGLVGIPFFSFDTENVMWNNIPIVLLIDAIFATIGIVCLWLWKKHK